MSLFIHTLDTLKRWDAKWCCVGPESQSLHWLVREAPSLFPGLPPKRTSPGEFGCSREAPSDVKEERNNNQELIGCPFSAFHVFNFFCYCLCIFSLLMKILSYIKNCRAFLPLFLSSNPLLPSSSSSLPCCLTAARHYCCSCSCS